MDSTLFKKQYSRTKAIEEWLQTFEFQELEWKIYCFKRKIGATYPTKDFSSVDVVKKFGRNPQCYITGWKIDYNDKGSFSLDHYLPPYRGGTNELANLKLCSIAANMEKGGDSINWMKFFAHTILSHAGYKIEPFKNQRRDYPGQKEFDFVSGI